MVRSIYPSIPVAGNDLNTMIPAVDAMRQTLNLIILNGLFPNPNYTPSETAQVFVTYAALTKTGIVGPQGPQGPPGPAGTPGIPEAPNDVNIYGRHALAWQNISVGAGMVSVAAPAGTNSTTFVMQGLDLSVTATVSTRLLLSVSGNVANSLNNGETDLQLVYGTGTPPANGAAMTGTPIGAQMRYEASTGGSLAPFAKTIIITGLTLGTTYWFDVGLKVVSGNGSITNVDLAGHGIV
jgi:hypothetical protein